MSQHAINELQRIFSTRLDTLAHILDIGEKHAGDGSFLQQRLAADMLPFAAQVVFASFTRFTQKPPQSGEMHLRKSRWVTMK